MYTRWCTTRVYQEVYYPPIYPGVYYPPIYPEFTTRPWSSGVLPVHGPRGVQHATVVLGVYSMLPWSSGCATRWSSGCATRWFSGCYWALYWV